VDCADFCLPSAHADKRDFAVQPDSSSEKFCDPVDRGEGRTNSPKSKSPTSKGLAHYVFDFGLWTVVRCVRNVSLPANGLFRRVDFG
jgi:hypothetical protein